MPRMTLRLLDPYSVSLNKTIKEIEDTISIIWTERFFEAGEFELVVPITDDNIGDYKEDRVIINDISEYSMIIENIEMNEATSGGTMTIKGHSVGIILNRRVVMEITEINNLGKKKKFPEMPLDEAVFTYLITPNFIDCDDETRNIDGFGYELNLDESLNDMDISMQIPKGTYVYDAICDICKSYNIGFKINIDFPINRNYPTFTMKFLTSNDYSYSNTKSNRFVVFTPENDNLFNMKYTKKMEGYKNYAYILGEAKNGNEKKRKMQIIDNTNGKEGFFKKELYVDASGISEQGVKKSVYLDLLKQEGEEKLASLGVMNNSVFDGEVFQTDYPFTYNKDYTIGDYVQLKYDRFILSAKVRINEVVRSEDSTGFKHTMAFENVIYIRNEDEEGWLKYVYYYIDEDTSKDVDYIVVTGLRNSLIVSDGLANLHIPNYWKGYEVRLDLTYSE